MLKSLNMRLPILCYNISNSRHDEIEKEHRRVTSDHEQELRTMANKHKATVEFLNKEHELVTVKVSITLYYL